MKKVITLLLASVFTIVITSNAQINKGSIMIGGTIGGSFRTVKNPDTVFSKNNSLTIQPSVGFGIRTNTIIGIGLLYETYKYQYSNDAKRKSFGVNAFLRQYKSLGKNFYLFGEGGLRYYHSTYNYSYQSPNEYDSKENGINLYITPGLSYGLSKSLQLEMGLQNLLSVDYSSSNEKALTLGNQSYKTSNFGFNTSFAPGQFNGVFVGIRFLFNK